MWRKKQCKLSNFFKKWHNTAIETRENYDSNDDDSGDDNSDDDSNDANDSNDDDSNEDNEDDVLYWLHMSSKWSFIMEICKLLAICEFFFR